MTKHQATATARDDDGFFDSVMATGSLRKLTKPKNESIRTGTKRPLEGTRSQATGGTTDEHEWTISLAERSCCSLFESQATSHYP